MASPHCLIIEMPLQGYAKSVGKLAAGFILVGAVGCSSEPTITDTASPTALAPASTTHSQGADTMQRVMITLNSVAAGEPEAGEAGKAFEAAVQRLSATFPDAKVLRTMPGFSQLVIELPANQLKALGADPIVVSVTPDARHRTQPIKPEPQVK